MGGGPLLRHAASAAMRASNSRYHFLSSLFSFTLMNPSASPPTGIQERRKFLRVREIFEQAYELIAPFFAKENRWGNATLDHLAYRVVRENYPELSFEEVHVLVVASRRVYTELEAESRARGG